MRAMHFKIFTNCKNCKKPLAFSVGRISASGEIETAYAYECECGTKVDIKFDLAINITEKAKYPKVNEG